MGSIDWSSLWRKEDWWSVWVGFIIIIIGLAGAAAAGWQGQALLSPWTSWYKLIAKPWGVDPIKGFVGMPWASAEHFAGWVAAFIFTLILTWIGVCAMEGRFVKEYPAAYFVMWILMWISVLLGSFGWSKAYGLEYPLWALIVGLFISNVLRVPKFLKPAVRTEFFIKIGLVILGLRIFFTDLVVAGSLGVVQALINVLVIWYVAYYICRGFGLDREFSSIMATGVSICGVSASIAAGGAVKGDPKYISYTISMVLITAVPMLIALPVIVKALAPMFGPYMEYVGGAWLGATIDTTPAVVAAGGFLGEKIALPVAAIVKMAQNVLIGVAAFILAVFWVYRVERKPEERVSPMEVWYRFPKFIVGFIIASIWVTLMNAWAAGAFGVSLAEAKKMYVAKWWQGIVDTYRGVIFFPLAFLGIGLDTNFRELAALGRGRPAAAYVVAQLINIAFSFFLVWALWGGVFFPPPKIGG